MKNKVVETLEDLQRIAKESNKVLVHIGNSNYIMLTHEEVKSNYIDIYDKSESEVKDK